MKQLPKEEQYYYEKDGNWLAFDKPQPSMGAANTYADFIDSQSPTEEQRSQINSAKAKFARDDAIEVYVGSVLFDGSAYQSSERSKKDITDTLEGAALQGLPDTASIQWRLEDNTYRETTVEELREILVLVKMDVLQNKSDVWSAFNAWQATDKQEPFSYE